MRFRSLRLPAQTRRNSQKNNARNIKYMAVLIFLNFSILNKTPILGQVPRVFLSFLLFYFF